MDPVVPAAAAVDRAVLAMAADAVDPVVRVTAAIAAAPAAQRRDPVSVMAGDAVVPRQDPSALAMDADPAVHVIAVVHLLERAVLVIAVVRVTAAALVIAVVHLRARVVRVMAVRVTAVRAMLAVRATAAVLATAVDAVHVMAVAAVVPRSDPASASSMALARCAKSWRARQSP